MSLFKLVAGSVAVLALLQSTEAATTTTYTIYCRQVPQETGGGAVQESTTLLAVAAAATADPILPGDITDTNPTLKICSVNGQDTGFGWACGTDEDAKCRNGKPVPQLVREKYCIKAVTTPSSTAGETPTVDYSFADDELCTGFDALPVEKKATAADNCTTDDKHCPLVIRRNKLLEANIHDVRSTGSVVLVSGGQVSIGNQSEWEGNNVILRQGPLATIFHVLSKLHNLVGV